MISYLIVIFVENRTRKNLSGFESDISPLGFYRSMLF